MPRDIKKGESLEDPPALAMNCFKLFLKLLFDFYFIGCRTFWAHFNFKADFIAFF